jgi:hypothetical protein
MTSFPNLEIPISNDDCAEIEAIFIELIRVWVGAAPGKPVNSMLPALDPPSKAQDLRSQSGLQ